MGNADAMIKQWADNYKRLRALDSASKKAKKLVGRYISEPIGDGHAFYLITKENKKTVQIELVNGLGDDYCVSYWGDVTRIDKNYAVENLRSRDGLEKIFGERDERS